MTEFKEFPKIGRLTRNCVVTEKIDGTNACVYVGEDGEFLTGSRTRWVDPRQDNHGFSRWAHEHKDELLTLGPGCHFGEWWGLGIQRGYGVKEKRFSLFNTHRWSDELGGRPACCWVVPVLYQGMFDTKIIDTLLDYLDTTGSIVAPGFMKPEGVVIYHEASKTLFKKTIEKDDVPKGFTV